MLINDTVASNCEGSIMHFDFARPDSRRSDVSRSNFCEVFDANNLAALIQDKTRSGKMTRLGRFIGASETFANGASAAPDGDRDARKALAGIASDIIIHDRCGGLQSLRRISNW